jgi:hypothetical protein
MSLAEQTRRFDLKETADAAKRSARGIYGRLMGVPWGLHACPCCSWSRPSRCASKAACGSVCWSGTNSLNPS